MRVILYQKYELRSIVLGGDPGSARYSHTRFLDQNPSYLAMRRRRELCATGLLAVK